MNHDDLWREHALCLTDQFDADMWFPRRGDSTANAAKQICSRCFVKADCLQAALTVGEQHGIWGGAGEPIRRHLRRFLADCPHPRGLGPAGCDCTFCRAVHIHFDRLRQVGDRGRAAAGQPVSFGVRATHGRKSTYKRGCRGDQCRMAMGLKPLGVSCPGFPAVRVPAESEAS